MPAHVPDLTALTLLVAVARTTSLAEAARELDLSVQAASARIRSVERRLGAPVLQRGRQGRRSSRLTARGALLVEWAGPVLDAARDLDAAVTALRPPQPDADPVVLAVAPTVAEHLLPGWLVHLRAGPGGEVALLGGDATLDDPAGDPAGAVRDGAAAVGVVETGTALAGLHATTVATDDLVLVVSPGHPWAGGPGVDAAELAATPQITRRPGGGARGALADALAEAVPGVAPAAPVCELATDAAVRAAVRADAGPAVLPRLAVAADLATGALTEVAVHGLQTRREFRAVWPEGTSLRGTARDLLRIATGGRLR
ncbi:LysR family transcriptional regulator [Pseudonocardia nantongensis]|uniref:LysR family transcriptional regulator n=1 Tax=Pseudonocardia nantongensis TaxID=1181885 RepID=UPI00397D0A03